MPVFGLEQVHGFSMDRQECSPVCAIDHLGAVLNRMHNIKCLQLILQGKCLGRRFLVVVPMEFCPRIQYNSELPNWIDEVIFLYVRPSLITFAPSI
jgi:hypothetical protein